MNAECMTVSPLTLAALSWAWELLNQIYTQVIEPQTFCCFGLWWQTSGVASVVHQEFGETANLFSSCETRYLRSITSLDRFTSLAPEQFSHEHSRTSSAALWAPQGRDLECFAHLCSFDDQHILWHIIGPQHIFIQWTNVQCIPHSPAIGLVIIKRFHQPKYRERKLPCLGILEMWLPGMPSSSSTGCLLTH